MDQSGLFRRVVPALAFVASAVVTAVLGAQLLLYLQAREPDLVYVTAPTSLVVGQTQTSARYDVSISNEGKETVEDVDCHVVIIGTPTIEDVQIAAAPAVTYSYSIVSNSVHFHFPWLNPAEKAQLKVLAITPNKPPNLPGQLPNRPNVSLRGKGVSGVERSGEGLSLVSWILLSVAGLGVGSFALMIALHYLERPVTRKRESEKAP